ncbi:MAG: hypothetical protein QXU74_00990 [Candidatus Aenigmatarchaeota archaeon]
MPIAFDSLGTRSMACSIVTKDKRILIDPIYVLGYRYGYENFQASIQNLIKIVGEISPKTLILDYRLLIDLKYKEKNYVYVKN